MLNPVNITLPALTEIRQILKKKGIPADYSLRLGVKGSHGCAGVNFILGFDKKKDNDLSYQVEGIEVLIQKSVLMFLVGKKVDFYEGSEARGFVFVEDNQPSSSTVAR